MRKRIRVGAAFVAASVAMGAWPAEAYNRNAVPEVTSDICYWDGDVVIFYWSTAAGKPLSVSIAAAGGFSQDWKIPGSRGAKGNWSIDLTPGDTVIKDILQDEQLTLTLTGRAGDSDPYLVICND